MVTARWLEEKKNTNTPGSTREARNEKNEQTDFDVYLASIFFLLSTIYVIVVQHCSLGTNL